VLRDNQMKNYLKYSSVINRQQVGKQLDNPLGKVFFFKKKPNRIYLRGFGFMESWLKNMISIY